MVNQNLGLLKRAASQLSPLLSEVVFVGGCVTGLLITDEATPPVRPTTDVDVIAEITSYADYEIFSKRLRKLGFTEDNEEGAPICRWQKGLTKLDVMPLNEEILGFSNCWYKPAMEAAWEYNIEKDLRLRVVTAPYFCATKLEAFKSRGNGDYLASHDLEDLITIVDGRSELLDELRIAPEDVRSYIADSFDRLLKIDEFLDALPGHIIDQGRFTILLSRLEQIAKL
jgi:predicted nucleotidyltransferase